MIDVSEHPCIEHQRGQPCGKTWFQFTAHGHTVGACSTIVRETRKCLPAKGPCTGRESVDKDTGQIMLELFDKKGDVIAALALSQQPS